MNNDEQKSAGLWMAITIVIAIVALLSLLSYADTSYRIKIASQELENLREWGDRRGKQVRYEQVNDDLYRMWEQRGEQKRQKCIPKLRVDRYDTLTRYCEWQEP